MSRNAVVTRQFLVKKKMLPLHHLSVLIGFGTRGLLFVSKAKIETGG